MSVVVSVYSEKALKEFVLPATVNTEAELSVRRDVFGLDEHITLRLENLDGEWRFLPSPCISVFRGETPYAGEPLKDRDYFRCVAKGRMLLAMTVSVTDRRFEGFSKYRLTSGAVTIGRDADCGLRYSFESGGAQYVGREHAVIALSQNSLTLTDKSRNGVFLNDRRVSGTVPLHFGDRIDVWGLNLVALGTVLAVRQCQGLTVDGSQLCPGDAAVPAAVQSGGKLRYHRSPRTVGRLSSGTIEIEAPPTPQQTAEAPLFLTIGPALTMALPMIAGSAMAVIGSGTGGTFMYTGIITAVLSAMIGAAWAVANLRYARKMSKRAEEHRFSAYSDYLLRVTEEIRELYERDMQVLKSAYPPAEECLKNGLRLERLWERNANHEDVLTYRLGLGDVPFQTVIRAPREQFDLIDDSLREKPRMIQEDYQTLHNVPVCIDLRREHVAGLVGGPDLEGAHRLLECLVAQIAAQNCYTEVKMAFLYRQGQGDDARRWGWCRWLPHVWSEGRRARFVAADRGEASDVFFDLAAVLRARSERSASGREESFPKPWYILVLEDSSWLENEPVAKFLLESQDGLGVTTILLADRQEDLPNSCECVVRMEGESAVMYHTRAGEQDEVRFVPDRVDSELLEQLARALASVEVSETEIGGEIPRAVSFFEMYGITRLDELRAQERWKKNRNYENMRALIGVKSGGQPCYLDVHEKYHGPHGLVAGTTGSGKSETLQTYILSLAVNFSPDDVGLFIIDYKGGGMANLFDGLPHILGQISNLSGGQVHRAMASIKSENMRRQRIFNENGVNNINLYTTLYKNGEAAAPVPHLFIIIDEFAELKREQPDFMRELISVAQVGRSLGVHLILATQKPSGTVDDNIWSNSKFRLCLRVQDRQDSMDMLHKPDAAYLTQAGRGFLQVGNDEIFEQFQSGWSGADYDEDAGTVRDASARMLTNPGRTALTGSYVKRRTKERRRRQWMAALCQAAEKAGVTGGDAQSVDAAYTQLEADGVDYARSDYNSRLLSDMLELYTRAAAEDVPGEDRPQWIMELAARENIKLPEQKSRTQLSAVVDYLAQTARAAGYARQQPLWLPPLPAILPLQKVPGWEDKAFQNGVWPAYGKRWNLTALVGLADDPSAQTQMPVKLDLTEGGHCALIGAAGTGKSTFAQTLIYSLLCGYSPEYLNVYILDFSSRMLGVFEDAPGVGGVLFENQVEQVGKLFYLLQEMVAERKRLFQGGSFSQYVMVNGPVCPAVLLVVDGMANFREKTGEQYDDALIRLAREGAAYGVYLFLTGGGFGMADIPGRLGDHIPGTICLSLSDIYQYGEALRIPQPGVFPESGIHGRGLVDMDGTVLEYQTALAVEAGDDFSRAEALRAACREMSLAWKGRPARPIPFIPEKPVWTDLEEREEFPRLARDPRILPVGFVEATAGLYGIDLSQAYCCLVSGRQRTGKTNALKLLLRSAQAKGGRLAVIEPKGTTLQMEAQARGVRYCVSLEEIVAFVGDLAQEFRARNGVKKEMLAAGADMEMIFQRMSREEPWFIFISDLADFVDIVYSPQGREAVLNGALENLIGKGFLHNIYWIAGFNQDDRVRVMGKEVYESYIKDPSGIHLGGNAAAQQIFDFSSIPFSEQSQVTKPGIALAPARDGEPLRRVVIPLARDRDTVQVEGGLS